MQQGGKYYYVYITASISKVLYVGYTDCLVKRINQHKKGTYKNSFTNKYNVNKLVYWEHFYSKQEALNREKQIKGYRREKKIELIDRNNFDWKDLFVDIINLSKVRLV